MKKIISLVAFPILIFILTSPAVSAVGTADNLRHMKNAPDGKDSDIIRIILDSEIYDSVSADFADIRLTDGKKNETPFIVRLDTVNETQITDIYHPAKIISLTRHDDHRIDICVEIPENSRDITGLVLKTPSKNFEKLVDVYGSSNMKTWKTMAEDQGIFDYSEVVALSNTTIRFSGTGFKYYNISISNFTEERKSPRSELILISTKKEPLTLFTLETESNNFSRAVSVDGSDDKKDWRNLTDSEKITKIGVSGYRETDLDISIPESRFKYYRIRVSNGDAPPAGFSAVHASGNIYRLELINPKTSGSLSVYYGGSDIPLPSYDIKEILDKLENPSYSEIKLGEEKENPRYKPGMKNQHFLDSKILFYSIIALMVLILGWVLRKGFRKIDTMHPE
ncbi:MAG: DUF3999 family protein [Lentisphaerae bacterium]|nr:DUF3999 family protein [Lentisphaerota bacterium]